MSTAANLEPQHLRELADLIEGRRWERVARLAEVAEKPAIGAFRVERPRDLPEPPSGYQWNDRALLEPVGVS